MLATSYKTIIVDSYEDFYEKIVAGNKQEGELFGVNDQYIDLDYDTTNKTDLEKIQSTLDTCPLYLFNVFIHEGKYFINVLDVNISFAGGYLNFGEDGALGGLYDKTEIDEFEFIDATFNNVSTLSANIDDIEDIKRVDGFLTDKERLCRLKVLLYKNLGHRKEMYDKDPMNGDYDKWVMKYVYQEPYRTLIALNSTFFQPIPEVKY